MLVESEIKIKKLQGTVNEISDWLKGISDKYKSIMLTEVSPLDTSIGSPSQQLERINKQTVKSGVIYYMSASSQPAFPGAMADIKMKLHSVWVIIFDYPITLPPKFNSELKPDGNVTVPEFITLSEGYDPDQPNP